MAQQIEVLLLDDLDPNQTADETITFGYDGQAYEIDLTADHAAKLRKSLQPYVDVARLSTVPRAGRGRPTAHGTRPASDRAELGEARAWLKERYPDMKDRGRIPANLLAEWQNRNQVPAAEFSAPETESEATVTELKPPARRSRKTVTAKA